MAKQKAVSAEGGQRQKAVTSPPPAGIKVRLNHYSHRKGCEGEPGDVVEVDEATAAFLVEQGCVRV